MSKPGSFTAAIFAIAINCVACRISAEERAHTEAFLTRLSNRPDQGVETKIEAPLVVGDHVTVLGQVSTRDGVAGFWGDVIIVQGTYEKWHSDAARKSPISIPEQGYIQP